ncbi:MAG: hypothetical protein ACC641_11450, partial [Acidiferrobacterales bacterium]
RPKRTKKTKKGWRIAGFFSSFLVVAVLAILMIIGAAEMLGYLPPTGVVTGKQLSQYNRRILVENKYISGDEEIIYFYSASLFRIKEDGNLLTRRRVISYWEGDAETGYDSIDLDEIVNVSVDYSKRWDEDSKITVTSGNNRLILFVPGDDGMDTRFVEKLNDLVKKKQLRNRLISGANTA